MAKNSDDALKKLPNEKLIDVFCLEVHPQIEELRQRKITTYTKLH